MSIYQTTNSSSSPSIPFSILDLKAQSVRLPVSKGAQILLSELLTWSGERGYCWWSNKAIARDLKWSVVFRMAQDRRASGSGTPGIHSPPRSVKLLGPPSRSCEDGPPHK